MPENRDWAEIHNHWDGSSRRVPVVRVEDSTYCDDPHLLLYSDQERRLMSATLKRMRDRDVHEGAITRRERRIIYAGGVIVAFSSAIAALASVYGLLTGGHP